jgi:two-component system OmpR family sensor kinase
MLGRIEGEFEQRRRTEDRLRQFAADASHELRTPVTTVRGYAELYRSGALDEPGELAEAMRRVEQETVRMGELVDDLLRLARLDQGRQVERTAVDLAAVVRDAGRDAQATEPDRPITVEADGAAVVPGDERLLRQLVANLTANALVHTESTVAIHLRASVEGDRAVVEVRDEGPGMAPEVAERVFERFYRADPSRSRHSGGSGLGLAIVEATVHAHGGAVAVTTVPGEGTTFRVELPTD